MTIRQIVSKYLKNTDQTLQNITKKTSISNKKVEEAIDLAFRYFKDAEYFQKQKRFEVALASVAYCEGLVDSLRILGLIEIKAPTKKEVTSSSRSIVLASGVFDLLHLGHVKFLEEAKKAGGEKSKLIVIVARDKTVRKRKGEKTIMSENQRRALVESLEVVDEAILGFDEFSIEKIIERIRPSVIAVGHDQKGIEKAVRKALIDTGLEIRVVKVGKFSEDELDSSSEIKKKITELYTHPS